jgi:RNA polymerase primary sigma factor
MRQIQITASYTNADSAALEKYLNELGRTELLTAEEEIILGQKIRQGDHAALQRLTQTNLRFVVSVAKKYQYQGLPLSDLISEGNLGLMKAAKKFDETKGFKFISYAVWWIRQSIIAAIAEHSRMVRIPMNQVGDITRMNKAAAVLEQQLERQPSLNELAEFMQITESQLTGMIRASQRTSSYDAPMPNEHEFCLLDVIQNDDLPTDYNLNKYFDETLLRELMTTLTSRDAEVIRWCFGIDGKEPLVIADIAPIMGISSERVRQIRNNALLTLRTRAMQLNESY